MDEEQQPVTVEEHRTVSIHDRDTGAKLLELTNKNGEVSVVKGSNTRKKIPLGDLADAVEKLKG